MMAMMGELSIPAAIILASVLFGLMNSGLQILDRMYFSRKSNGNGDHGKNGTCHFDRDRSDQHFTKQNELLGSMLGNARSLQQTSQGTVEAVRELREVIKGMQTDQHIYHERLINYLDNSDKKLDVVIKKLE